jgi:hypothetical protein
MAVRVSREGAPDKRPKAQPAAGTPIWVWVIYTLGILAVSVVVLSGLFTAGAYFLSGDVPVGVEISTLAIVVWGGLIVLAAATWLSRRRRARR